MSLAAFALALNGCRSMTLAEQAEFDSQKELEESRPARLAEQRARMEELLRQQTELNDRAAREQQRFEADAARSEGRFEEAISMVTELLDRKHIEQQMRDEEGNMSTVQIEAPRIPDSERAQLLSIAALAHHQAGRTDEAIETYRQAVKLDPTQRVPRQNLGRMLYNEERWAEALDVFDLEFKEGYRSTEILAYVAQAQYALSQQTKDRSRLEAARLAFEELLLNEPTNIDYRRWLAYIEYESGRYDQAIRLIETIRQTYPTDPIYLAVLADCYEQTGQVDKAIEALELSVRVQKDKVPDRLCLQLGDLYATKRMPGSAAEWFLRAHDGDPKGVRPAERLFIGRLLGEADRSQEALEWLGSIEETDADAYFDAQAYLASMYRELGEDDKALEAFANIRRVRPTDGLAHLSAGDIYLERSELDKAFEAYNRAASLDSSRADGFAGLAEVAYAREELELAVSYYRKAVAAAPEDGRFPLLLREIEEELRVKELNRQFTDSAAADPSDSDDATGADAATESDESAAESPVGSGEHGVDSGAALSEQASVAGAR